MEPSGKGESNSTCYRCGKAGHVAAKGHFKEAIYVPAVINFINKDMEEILPGQALLLNVPVMVDDWPISVEVDTGAALSLVSESTFRKLWPGNKLLTSTVRLCSQSSEPISVVGRLDVGVGVCRILSTLHLISELSNFLNMESTRTEPSI